MENHYNILIATPGRDMEAEYVVSLINTVSHLNKEGITFLFLNKYSSMVSSAREATVMGSNYLDAFCNSPVSGKVTYDKIIWIDSDISWEIEDFMKIYESDKDIISGVYFNQEGTPMFSVDSQDAVAEITRVLNSENDEKIYAAGFGFIGMKSGVFEKIERPWFDSTFHKISNDDKTKEFFIPLGEDYSWCDKAKKSGFSIFLDPSVILTHHKKVAIRIGRNK
jgi:hypothetical protein